MADRRMCGSVAPCAGRISAASGLHGADQNIMTVDTQKEKSKQEEESRDLFCLVSDAFRIFARRSSIVLGSAWAFASAILVIIIWGLTGPTFHYSNTWQLIINTGTTIVTFLMVFLIQRTQNKDALALQLKLNEIVAAVEGASNRLVSVEDLSERELATLHAHFQRLAEMAGRDTNLLESHS